MKRCPTCSRVQRVDALEITDFEVKPGDSGQILVKSLGQRLDSK